MSPAAGPEPERPPWWSALPPAEAQVPCGEQTHRLLWAEGRLTARDHPDAEGELVLAALGGERSACLDLVEAWGTRRDDLEVLAIGPRSAADVLTIAPDDIEEMRAAGAWLGFVPLRAGRGPWPAGRPRPAPWPRPGIRWPPRLPWGAAGYGGFVPGSVAMRRAAAQRRARAGGSFARLTSHRMTGHASVGRATAVYSSQRITRPGRPTPDAAERAAARRVELLSLMALGPDFQFRLSATVAAAWADGGSRAGDRDAARPALVAALTGRLAPAARSWLGIDPDRVDVSLHEDAGWGRVALSGTGPGRRLEAALPAGWLASVWAAGLAVAAGHLVVEIRDVAWPEATVLGVPEPGADPAILKVRAAGARWLPADPAAGGGPAAAGGEERR